MTIWIRNFMAVFSIYNTRRSTFKWNCSNSLENVLLQMFNFYVVNLKSKKKN